MKALIRTLIVLPVIIAIASEHVAAQSGVLAPAPSIKPAPRDPDEVKKTRPGVTGVVRPVYQVEPVFPRKAFEARQEGWVYVEFTVSAKGDVVDPKVIDSSPPEMFDAAAIRAVSKWKYEFLEETVAPVSGVTAMLTFKIMK